MGGCEFGAGCTFLEDRMSGMPTTARMFRDRYCLGRPEQCARHLASQAVGQERVPADLYPNQHARAQELAGPRRRSARIGTASPQAAG